MGIQAGSRLPSVTAGTPVLLSACGPRWYLAAALDRLSAIKCQVWGPGSVRSLVPLGLSLACHHLQHTVCAVVGGREDKELEFHILFQFKREKEVCVPLH